jgi:lipopolysaccharide assembly outer membrane protein LptD (OstA)
MLTFAFAVLLSLAPQQAVSDPAANCASLTYDPESNTYRGSGGCILQYGDMRFESAWVELNQSTGVVTAGDHIRFTRGAEDMEGSHVEMNV